VSVKGVTERNVYWCLLVSCTAVKFSNLSDVTPCSLVSVYGRFERCWYLRNCAEHSPDDTSVRYVIVQCLLCYCECGSVSVAVTAVS